MYTVQEKDDGMGGGVGWECEWECVFEVVFAPAIKVPKNVDGGDGAVICM